MKAVVISPALVLLAACAPMGTTTAAAPADRAANVALQSKVQAAYEVSRSTDEFTKDRYADLTWYSPFKFRSDIACSHSALRSHYVLLAARRFIGAKGDTTALLAVTYMGSEWLFLSREGALSLLVDDVLVEPGEAMEPSRDVGRSGTVTENQWYKVDRMMFNKIASAARVRARVAGSKGACDLTIPQREEFR